MKEPRILLLETSTESCSVALCEGTTLLAKRYTDTPKLQSSLLAPFVDEVLREAGLKAAECDAVAVSEGPGSYTGLRVGVSTAKGICFGAGLPLIAVGTLRVLAEQGRGEAGIIVPMIDARRMEVYAAVFDGRTLEERSGVEAVILDENSYREELAKGSVLFIGNGVEKFRPLVTSPNACFCACYPDAAAMIGPALESWQKKEFKDVAYFEPFYLKEFVAGISTRAVL
ncbi:MAG: tRNA (adenosine(37)-N6)-threonylcarbamoyltransferase complex dimerization subunit type 1 TsaB [Bacteroidales bacterium]|nr:tRNA (adenosine(37)-N6)-threonylcarbamoyltransferase complex dimerization subunit type 1 TsaB [Bacteroidales bacterium]